MGVVLTVRDGGDENLQDVEFASAVTSDENGIFDMRGRLSEKGRRMVFKQASESILDYADAYKQSPHEAICIEKLLGENSAVFNNFDSVIDVAEYPNVWELIRFVDYSVNTDSPMQQAEEEQESDPVNYAYWFARMVRNFTYHINDFQEDHKLEAVAELAAWAQQQPRAPKRHLAGRLQNVDNAWYFLYKTYPRELRLCCAVWRQLRAVELAEDVVISATGEKSISCSTWLLRAMDTQVTGDLTPDVQKGVWSRIELKLEAQKKEFRSCFGGLQQFREYVGVLLSFYGSDISSGSSQSWDEEGPLEKATRKLPAVAESLKDYALQNQISLPGGRELSARQVFDETRKRRRLGDSG